MASRLEPSSPPPIARFEKIHVDALAQHRGLVDAVLAQKIAGIVVEGAMDPTHVATVLARLERDEFAIAPAPSEHFRKHFTVSPRPLASARGEGQLAEYVALGQPTIDAIREVFRDGDDYLSCVERVVGGLSAERPVKLLARDDGGPFVPATIRRMRAGGEMGIHCELETLHFDGMKYIAPYVDSSRILSIYLGLQYPERGGELCVYDMVFGEPSAERMKSSERIGEPLVQAVQDVPHWKLRLGPGDLVIFDAGRYFHRVAFVDGPSTRWTMGSLACSTKDGSALGYWG